MKCTKRSAGLLSIAAFLVTIFLFIRSKHSAPWQAVPQMIGLGIGVDNDGDSGMSNEFKENRITAGSQLDQEADKLHTLPVSATTELTKYLVMAKTKKEDISWMDEADLGNITTKIYVADDPKAPLHPPENKGHEVMVYLTYIIDHYDMLPDVSIFMHSHQYAWHNNDLLNNDAAEMIRRLSSERVQREGYMNLRCHWMPGCPNWMHPGAVDEDHNKMEESVIASAWAELFPDRPVPEVLAQPCCSQFAVSRDQIRTTAKKSYIMYRDWMLATSLRDSISGRVWEWLWHVIFTGESVLCPNMYTCYCDGYGVCFEDEKSFDYWFELRWNKRVLQGELDEWNERAEELEEFRKDGHLVGIESGEIHIPEPGKDIELRKRIHELEDMMEFGRLGALERGRDPKIRAASARRKWQPGDGY